MKRYLAVLLCLVVFFVAAAMAIFYVPNIISRKDFQQWAIKTFVDDELHIKRATFSWSGPQSIENISYRSKSLVIKAKSLKTDAELLTLLYQAWLKKDFVFKHQTQLMGASLDLADMGIRLNKINARVDNSNNQNQQNLHLSAALIKDGVNTNFTLNGVLYSDKDEMDIHVLIPKISADLLTNYIDEADSKKFLKKILGEQFSARVNVKGPVLAPSYKLKLTSQKSHLDFSGKLAGSNKISMVLNARLLELANQGVIAVKIDYDHGAIKSELKGFPTKIIVQLVNVIGASKVLEDLLGKDFDVALNYDPPGQILLDLNARHLKANIDARYDLGKIYLNKEARLEIKPTGIVQDYLLVGINPLLNSGVSSDVDSVITIDPAGFAMSWPFSLDSFAIKDGTLKLGALKTSARGPMAKLLAKLKIMAQGELESKKIRFTKTNFAVNDGLVSVKKFDAFMSGKKQFSLFGYTDLKKELSSFKLERGAAVMPLDGPVGQATASIERGLLKQKEQPLGRKDRLGRSKLSLPLIGQDKSAKILEHVNPWRLAFHLGANFDFSHGKYLQSSTDSQFMKLGALFKASAIYERDPHIWRNDLLLVQAFNLHRGSLIKASDLVELDSTYLYLLKSWLALFGQLSIDSNLLPGIDSRGSDYTYRYTHNQETLPTNGSKIRLSDPFLPLYFKETFGVMWRPITQRYLLWENRAGLSFIQTIAEGQLALHEVDNDKKIIGVKALNSFMQMGPVVGSSISGNTLLRRLTYNAGIEAMWPLWQSPAPDSVYNSIFGPINIDAYAGLGFSLLEWLSIESQTKLTRVPEITDDWQFNHNIFILLSYSFGRESR